MRENMRSENPSLYHSTQKTVSIYLGILVVMSLILAVLHYLFADLRVEGIRWFNLDRERNLPTWFSGALFTLFGCSAMVAYYWETRINARNGQVFRLPILWLGVGLVGLLMSLDEITILHENILWREVRQTTVQLSDTWIYVTQWQVLYAPAILILLGYFVLFFCNRFNSSPAARRAAFAGIGCWVVGLLLEGLRGTFRQLGDAWYSGEVVVEEVLEMAGAICLMGAIVFYTVDIALDLSEERRRKLQLGLGFFTPRALKALGVTLVALIVVGSTIFIFARRQAMIGAPIPSLIERAVGEEALFDSLAPATESDEVWFDDLQSTVAVTDEQTEALIRFAARAIFSSSNTEVFPESLRGGTVPRIVFLSLSDGQSASRVVRGAGRGFAEAMERALEGVQKSIQGGYRPKWLKLDVVQDVSRLREVDPEFALELPRSLYGLAFDRASGVAFLPEELVAYTLMNSDQELRFRNMQRHSTQPSVLNSHLRRLRRSDSLTLYRFTTAAYFSDGEEWVQLFRGHRFFEEVTRDEMLSAAVSGGHYLTREVDPVGRFTYSYLPKTDEVPDSYNILRHAGTLYSMLELYDVTRDGALLRSAQRALDDLAASALPCQLGGEEQVCIVEEDEVKLGGNALAAVALAKYIEVTGDRTRLSDLVAWGRTLQALQYPDGNFIHKVTYPFGENSGFVSEYYPGEALLALVRIYGQDPDQGWLDTAEKGAQYLIKVRDADLVVEELTHDHWLLYALNELFRHRPDPLYLDHAMRIAQAIVLAQNRDPEYPDWLGSYYEPPRSTPTATRTEGLCAAYQLARDFETSLSAEDILEAMELGIAFQLQTQFRPESLLYVRDPQRSLGGFHYSLTNFRIRIDYVQHNISGLLCTAQVLSE